MNVQASMRGIINASTGEIPIVRMASISSVRRGKTVSAIDPATDSVTVRAVFPNKHIGTGDYDLIPGQYAPVRLILGENPDALLIPETALVETQAGTNVFVVGKDNKVERRAVETGFVSAEGVVVAKGLSGNEKVVLRAGGFLNEGEAINPKLQKAAGER